MRRPKSKNLIRTYVVVNLGGAEFAGPENDGPKKIKDWKMQDLENDGPFVIF